MIGRVLFAIAGLVCIGIVGYFGWAASTDGNYVTIFGLTAALVAPVGIALLAAAFSSRDLEALRDLSKVPKIQELIRAAQSQEEKIAALERERHVLEEVVQFEAKRMALLERKELLNSEAIRLLGEFDRVQRDLSLIDSAFEDSPDSESIAKLRDRLELNRRNLFNLKIGHRSIVINLDAVEGLPGGYVLVGYFYLAKRIVRFIRLSARSMTPNR